MPRSEKQKLKTLYVAKYLWENTDENNGVRATDIAADLEFSYGIQAEEHSFYRDIAALRDVFGLEIEGGRGKKYRLVSRSLSYDDLRILAECVNAARFLSESEAKRIIGALGALCSKKQKESLDKETYVSNRVRTTEKSVLKNAGIIRQAIKNKTMISFQYIKTSIDTTRSTVHRRNGPRYTVSPFTLLVEGGNYYMLAYSAKEQLIKTFRVDRMRNVDIFGLKRQGEDRFNILEIRTYTRRVFGMFGGETKRVIMRFDNCLLEPVADRLGTEDVKYKEDDNEHFTVSANVVVSPQFYAWVFGFGNQAEIVGPPDVAEGMKEQLKNVTDIYR